MVREPLNDLSVIESVVVGSLVSSVVGIVVDSMFSVVSVTVSIYVYYNYFYQNCNLCHGLLFENSHKKLLQLAEIEFSPSLASTI